MIIKSLYLHLRKVFRKYSRRSCTSGLFRLLFHLPVHAVPLILKVVEVSAQLRDDLDMFAELDDLFLQVRVRLHNLVYLPLQTDSLLLQSLYLLFQSFHLLLVVLPLDLNVVLCDSANNQLVN